MVIKINQKLYKQSNILQDLEMKMKTENNHPKIPKIKTENYHQEIITLHSHKGKRN